MSYHLSIRSLENLEGVHPQPVFVVKRAIEITEVDFAVIEGLRTIERQIKLVEAGASWTLDSYHIKGLAVDLAAFIGGKLSWAWPPYYKIKDAMFQAAHELGVKIEWGGHWPEDKKDGPHFQFEESKSV